MTNVAHFTVKEFGKHNKKVIFLLGGWKTKQWLYFLPATILAAKGYHCVVYTYERSILSPNIKRTLTSFKAVRNAVLSHIVALQQQGIKEVSLFGYSLGAVLSCMIANKSRAVSKVTLNTIGTSVASAVWSWDDRMSGFKQSLQSQGYTLESLEKYWYELAPVHNLQNMKDKQLLVYLVRNDQVIPYSQGKEFITILKQKELPFTLITNNRGSHGVAGIANIYRIRRYIKFLG